MAQNVYSLNIVGYATVSAPAGYSILANPLSGGQTNGANEILPPITGMAVLTWNGAGFDYASYQPAFNPPPGTGWVDVNLAPANPPSLPPGKGFFFQNPASTPTNITFVGQVVPGPSSTNTLALAPGYSMVGSPLPAAVTDITTSPVNLPKVPSEAVLTWNGSGYTTATYNPAFNPPPGSGWVDANLAPIAAPSYSIGEGFFFQNPNNTAINWVQSLP